MKRIFLCFTILVYVSGCKTSGLKPSAHANNILFVADFESSLVSNNKANVEITVPGTVRTFSAPEDYGGSPVFTKYVESVTAINEAGQPLPAQIQGSKVLIEPNGSEKYTLKYVYRIPQKISGEVDQSLPNLDEHYGRIDNNTFLLTPEGLTSEKATLRIQPPKGWPVATSWGKGTNFEVGKVSELTSGMIVLGDFDYSQENIEGLSVTFAIKGNYPHEVIKNQFAKVLKSQIEIAGPLATNQFLVVFQPTANACCKGTALTNSLNVNIPADEKLEPFNFRAIGTTSHELFHQWNFKSVYPASEDGAYLFSEGFTNYFSVAALVRAGLVPPESFAWFLWHYRNLLEKNPKYRGADFAKIQSGFKTNDSDLVDLAYTRGPFVAVLLDIALREDTSDRESLTTWFRKLVEKYGGKKGYSINDLRDLVIENSGKPKGKAVAAFDDYFVGSKTINNRALFTQLGISCDEKTKKCSLKDIRKRTSRAKLFSADGLGQ